MEYKIKAKPTKYAGTEFRSRLEATWAAFFDLAGWKWKYEPFDLEGWMPDFEISHREHLPESILVEVKPTWSAAREAVEKIKKAQVEKALLLGNGPGCPEDEGLDWAVGQTWVSGEKPGPAFGVMYSDHGICPLISFCPRVLTDEHWTEATNITRWKRRPDIRNP